MSTLLKVGDRVRYTRAYCGVIIQYADPRYDLVVSQVKKNVVFVHFAIDTEAQMITRELARNLERINDSEV